MQADIVASAHYHDPGMTQQMVGDKMRTLLQVGTWKTGDDFFSLEYFARGRHGVWIALLTGQRLKDGTKQVEVFQDQECAVDAMRFYCRRLGLKEAA